MVDFHIRRPFTHELHLIADLHIASEIASVAGSAREAVYRNQDRDQKAESWKRFLMRQGHDMLVYAQDIQLCGFIAFGPSRGADLHLGEIYTLYVDPAYWRRGIGEALAQSALCKLRQQGFLSVTLWVYADNQRAICFYERLGFLNTGEQKGHQGEPESLALRFEALYSSA